MADGSGLILHWRSKEVIVNGHWYPSYSAAAKALRVSTESISDLVRRKGTNVIDNYTPQPRHKPRPITIDGVKYKSIYSAAKELGIERQKLYNLFTERKPSKAQMFKDAACDHFAMLVQGDPNWQRQRPWQWLYDDGKLRVQYWPSKQRWRHMGVSGNGNVFDLIVTLTEADHE